MQKLVLQTIRKSQVLVLSVTAAQAGSLGKKLIVLFWP